MLKIGDILSTIKSSGAAAQVQVVDKETNTIKVTRNWYEERTGKVIVQRNLLLVLSLILTVCIIASVLVVAFVVNSKQFDPFVIQLDDNTGRAAIVNPVSSQLLSGNDALSQFFIKKYLIARETYNPVDFNTTARTVVRLFSTSGVYYAYIGYVRNKNTDPVVMYGQDNTTFLMVKSWSKLAEDKYIVRFSINETTGNKRVFNKIAIVNFAYVTMELTEAERDVNPAGFQVNGYRVDDDNS